MQEVVMARFFKYNCTTNHTAIKFCETTYIMHKSNQFQIFCYNEQLKKCRSFVFFFFSNEPIELKDQTNCMLIDPVDPP